MSGRDRYPGTNTSRELWSSMYSEQDRDSNGGERERERVVLSATSLFAVSGIVLLVAEVGRRGGGVVGVGGGKRGVQG